MPEDNDRERPGALSEKLKKALSAGMGALLFTEESIRNYVKDAKLPRDIATYVVQNASRGKEELVSYVAKELTGMLQRMDVVTELERLLQRNTIRIRADIELIPKGENGGGIGTTDADIELLPRVVPEPPDDGAPEAAPAAGGV